MEDDMNLDDDTDDITADIEAAFAADAAPAEAPAAVAEDTAVEEGEKQEESRPRGPDGKFVAKEAEQGQDTPKPEEPTEPARTIRPPSSWSATAKADFAVLPEHIQQEVLKREREIEDGKAQWDTKAEKFNRFDALVAPHRDRLTLAGLDEFGYLNALIRADEMLRTNPQAALPQILRMYGLEAPQAQPQGQYQPQQQPDPAVYALQRQLAEIQERLTAQDTEREQQTKSEINGEIEAFRQDPANLYFDNVKPEMAALLKAGSAKDLKEAYDMACYARPDIRALLTKPAPAAAGEKKKAGVSVTGAPGLAKPDQTQGDPNRSIEDDVRAALEEVSGAV